MLFRSDSGKVRVRDGHLGGVLRVTQGIGGRIDVAGVRNHHHHAAAGTLHLLETGDECLLDFELQRAVHREYKVLPGHWRT